MTFESPPVKNEISAFDPERIINEAVERAGDKRSSKLVAILKETLKENGLLETPGHDWVDEDKKIILDFEGFFDLLNKLQERLPITRIESDPDAEADALGIREKAALKKQEKFQKEQEEKLEKSKKRWGYSDP